MKSSTIVDRNVLDKKDKFHALMDLVELQFNDCMERSKWDGEGKREYFNSLKCKALLLLETLRKETIISWALLDISF